MICPKCGKENPELGKFCNYCGASLEQGKLCSKCGAENPQTSKFCYNCGANLDQTNLCPKCGTEYNKDAKFCRSCGERLRSPEDETKPTANNVETLLSPDEKIIGRFSSIWREYYATNRRLIGFQRPDWVPLLLILGLLPGILAIILTRKEYMGVCEYSKISGVDLVRIREVILGALGIIIGIAFVIWGIFVLATLEDSGGIGLVLLMYSTDVRRPFSIRIYPVGIISRLLFLSNGAAITWLPIRYSGFLPDIRQRRKMPSALLQI